MSNPDINAQMNAKKHRSVFNQGRDMDRDEM